MKNLSKKILEAINTGVRMGLSLNDFDNTDDKLPTLKKDIKSKSRNVIKECEYLLNKQCENLEFDENTETYFRICKNFKYTPKSDNNFKELILYFIKETGNINADLNWIDTSNVHDMNDLFQYSEFNGDISKWDVSHVTSMMGMFKGNITFQGDISKWDVSNVNMMNSMFEGSKFDGDISNWDVSGVKNMSKMFQESYFTGNISKWDVSNVEDMHNMFMQASFGSDISNWDVHSVQRMDNMFRMSYFKGNISKWDVSAVKDMSYMFYMSEFNGDISKWNVSNVENMSHMFEFNYKFQGDISKWRVSNVTNMESMFTSSSFNGDISKWNVSNVTNMSHMFDLSHFSGDLSKWNLKNVTDFTSMFANSKKQVCKLDPIKNKFNRLYKNAFTLNGDYLIQSFMYMYIGWDDANIPQWFKELAKAGQEQHIDIMPKTYI